MAVEESPGNAMAQSSSDYRGLAREALDMVTRHDLSGLAADITFHATLAMLPFLLLLVSLPSVTGSIFSISDPAGQVSDKIGQVFSEDLGNSIRSLLGEVKESRGWSALMLGLGGSIWAGSSTISTIRKALNRIEDQEEECPFLKKKAIEVGLTVVIGLIVFSVIIFAVVGPLLLGVSGWIGEGVFSAYGLLAALVIASLLFWLAPSREREFKWVTPGAFLFVLSWLVFSLGFAFYIANVSNLNHVYGTLGIMAIAITWIYGSTLALLVGAEINTIIAKHHAMPDNLSAALADQIGGRHG